MDSVHKSAKSSTTITIPPFVPIISSGTYTLSSSLLPTAKTTLTVYHDTANDIWWASMEPRIADTEYKVVLRTDRGATLASFGMWETLRWRSRNLETGQVRGGEGKLVFPRDREEELTVELEKVPVLGTVCAKGWRIEGSGLEGDLEEEWESFGM